MASAGGSVEDFVEVFSAGPARINALPGKGTIAEGFDADLVVFDPAENSARSTAARCTWALISPRSTAGRSPAGPPSSSPPGAWCWTLAAFHDPGPVGRFVARNGFREHLAAAPHQSAAYHSATA